MGTSRSSPLASDHAARDPADGVAALFSALPCHMPVDKHQLMNAEADAAFADLKARMCANGWMVGEDTCAAVRAMVMWLMQHDLDGLASARRRRDPRVCVIDDRSFCPTGF